MDVYSKLELLNVDGNLSLSVDRDHEDDLSIRKILTDTNIPISEFKRNDNFFISKKEDKLCILYNEQKPIFVDFLSSKISKYAHKNSKKSMISKALGVHKKFPHLLDLTPGFGVDTFVVAKFFERVTLVERNPLMYLLLLDGLRRLVAKYPKLDQKFELIFRDSFDYISNQKNFSESCIYMDFMFEDKKTKSNKEMFFLSKVAHENDNPVVSEFVKRLSHTKAGRIVLKAKIIPQDVKAIQTYQGSSVNFFVLN